MNTHYLQTEWNVIKVLKKLQSCIEKTDTRGGWEGQVRQSMADDKKQTEPPI